jgi:ABC-type multidrug transport system fused ATPase/permease subunit
VARGVAGWPSVWGVRDGLLNRQGVERATVGATAALKTHNLLQMVVVIVLTRGESRRPWLELTAAAVFAVSGVVLLVAAFRAQRLPRAAVAVDVVVAVSVLLVAPLFQPVDPSQPWIDWPLFVAFLVAAEASACFSAVQASTATLCLMGSASSWLVWGSLPAASRQMIFASFVPFVAFAAVSYVFLHYLRRLAALADARAETIRMLEEERTRRVLHTPYRLLNDLAQMLRAEGDREGAQPTRQARLAEAVASALEIESIVRGTDTASSNVAADLQRLRDQFVDLPMIMNLEDAGVSLPPEAVYRIREAVRSALQNVRLHAQAKEVVVYASADRSSWVVSVHDDGRGFDTTGQRGVGLSQLVVAALEEIGARVRIESTPGQGTLIEISGDHQWTMDLAPASSS